jgi:hypothetical protein
MVKLKSFCVALVALFLVSIPVHAQFAGISPCAAESLSVSNSSGNVQLSACGPVVILYNITTQEAFYNLGSSSTAAATTSNYSLPGNSFVTLQINQNTTNWLAGITASSTTTFRVVQGFASP